MAACSCELVALLIGAKATGSGGRADVLPEVSMVGGTSRSGRLARSGLVVVVVETGRDVIDASMLGSTVLRSVGRAGECSKGVGVIGLGGVNGSDRLFDRRFDIEKELDFMIRSRLSKGQFGL
jgi:hypothetical protein